MVKKINNKVIYSFLGLTSFIIGLILIPFPFKQEGGHLGIGGNVAKADIPSPSPDGPSPDPCPAPDGPTPDPAPCPDGGPGPGGPF